MYEMACAGDAFECTQVDEDEEEEAVEADMAGNASGKDQTQCMEFMTNLTEDNEAEFVMDASPACEPMEDMDLKGVPDADDLLKLLEKPNVLDCGWFSMLHS